jgi:Tol biopolymer transport system component
MIGKVLGPFRIDAKLGSGGMGEVYLATDTRLGRRVAVKILAPDFSDDPSRRQRFEREARAVSSLAHPHICALYDVGQVERIAYLVMELVEGETLTGRIRKGALTLPDALRFAVQIADALAAAHRAGVVHRDLKPGNVMVTRSGVKLLDFGLAKLRRPERDASASQTALPTEAEPLTQKGTLLGTYHYMAPEQLEGEDADSRADVFAFGAVLYEMVTGKRAFTGSSPASLIGAILHTDPPPLSERQPLAPAALERVARKCLAKDREARWQSAQDLRDELEWILLEMEKPARAPVGARRRGWLPGLGWGLAAGLAVVLGLVALVGPRGSSPSPQVWAAIPAPDEVVELGVPALSPDGRTLVFEARSTDGQWRLWMRALGGGEARPLPGTEGAFLAMPFFSPDGRSVGFFAGGALRVTELASGRTVTLVEGLGFAASGTWAGEGAGEILFSSDLGPLRRVAGKGGAVREVTSLNASRGDAGHTWPSFLPDGRHFLFVVVVGRAPGIYLGSLDRGEIRRLIGESHYVAAWPGVQYSPSGHVVYLEWGKGTLLARPFDVDRLELIGEPVPLAEGVAHWGPGFAAFSASAEGTLAFREDSGWAVWQPVWLDRSGRELALAGPPGPYLDPTFDRLPRLSPDGRRLAVTQRQRAQLPEVWILDLERSTASPFAGGRFAGGAIWAPQGDRLAWGQVVDAPPQIYVKGLAGAGGEQRLTTDPSLDERWPADWSKNGRYLIYDQNTYGATNWDIYVLDLEANGNQPLPYLTTAAAERHAALSPTGRWLAYVTDVSGRSEVYLSAFPQHGVRWQASRGGGAFPQWSHDGREIFYTGPGGQVTVVRVEEGRDEVSLSEPEVLFQIDSMFTPAVASDGKRFLGMRRVQGVPLKPFTLVLDWPQALR